MILLCTCEVEKWGNNGYGNIVIVMSPTPRNYYYLLMR